MNEILNKNLEFIFDYNQQLVDKILNHTSLDKPVQLIESKSGDLNLLYDNEYVHDNIDPVYEAINLYQKNAGNDGNTKIHILYGLGLGYVLKRYSKKCNEKIVVLESNLDILRVTLELVDFSKELSKKNIKISSNFYEVRDCMKKLSVNYSDELTLSYTNFYYNLYSSQINGLMQKLKQINTKTKNIEKLSKINIGAGRWSKEGWLTLDCYTGANIQVDLRKFTPLPIDDNVFEKVFSSHCIEHIEDANLEHLLHELYRTMKPDAILRLACPDADMALEAYKNNNIKWFDGIHTKGDIGAKLVNTFVSYEAGQGGPKVSEEEVRENFNSLSKEDFINWCLSLCDKSRPYIAHINGIYYEKLEKMLKNAGFINIEKSFFKNSKDCELKGPEFDLHPTVSLFVECYKPGNTCVIPNCIR